MPFLVYAFGRAVSSTSLLQSLVYFPSERRATLREKKSIAVSFSSIGIHKDFWFQSFSSFSLLLLLSLLLSSFILCIFGIERLGEKDGERRWERKQKQKKSTRERERDSFGVKGEVLV